MKEFASWPNPINEKDSEIVQVLSVLVLIGSIYEYDRNGTVVGYSYLVYAFFVRLIAGPKIEPLHQLVIRYIRPSLENLHVIESHYISHYPKRFATFVGSCLAIITLVLVQPFVSILCINFLVGFARIQDSHVCFILGLGNFNDDCGV